MRRLWVSRRGRRFLIPCDRMPIGIALVLLVAAAGVLAGGNATMANDFAIMAYYLLVLRVGLQIFTHSRAQRAGKRARLSGLPHVDRERTRGPQGGEDRGP